MASSEFLVGVQPLHMMGARGMLGEERGWQRKGGWESAVNAVVEHGGKVHAVMVCVNMCRQWWRNAGQLSLLSLLSLVRLLSAGGPLRSTA